MTDCPGASTTVNPAQNISAVLWTYTKQSISNAENVWNGLQGQLTRSVQTLPGFPAGYITAPAGCTIVLDNLQSFAIAQDGASRVLLSVTIVQQEGLNVIQLVGTGSQTLFPNTQMRMAVYWTLV